jgi:hypothetical protein
MVAARTSLPRGSARPAHVEGSAQSDIRRMISIRRATTRSLWCRVVDIDDLVALILLSWVVVSIPAALLIGRWVEHGSTGEV